MADDSRKEDDLNDPERHPRDHDEGADALWLEEPSDDYGRDLEWVNEPSPEEVWERYRDGESESDRIQQLAEALVALRCNRVELLEALVRVKIRHVHWAASRRRLLDFTKLVHKAREHVPLSIGDRFSNDDWMKLQDLLGRYEEHLQAEAERAKRRPGRARTRALIALMDLVLKCTGDFQYQLLSKLLCLFVDDKLTEENLRQYAHDADLPKQRASKARLPARPTSKKGREMRLSGRVIGKRVNQAKARAGLDDWNDDE
jgi:hypothetical protein